MNTKEILLIIFSKDFIIDCIWPRIKPWTKEEENKENNRLNELLNKDKLAIDEILSHSDELRLFSLENIKEILDFEEERKKNIESKLTSIIGLTSIVATITIATEFTKPPELIQNYYIILLFIKTYIMLQLVSALVAAVNGLQRKSYQQNNIKDIMPKKDETKSEFQIKIMKSYAECFWQNNKINSEKIDQMAIAHRALKNLFFFSLGCSSIFLVIKLFIYFHQRLSCSFTFI